MEKTPLNFARPQIIQTPQQIATGIVDRTGIFDSKDSPLYEPLAEAIKELFPPDPAAAHDPADAASRMESAKKNLTDILVTLCFVLDEDTALCAAIREVKMPPLKALKACREEGLITDQQYNGMVESDRVQDAIAFIEDAIANPVKTRTRPTDSGRTHP